MSTSLGLVVSRIKNLGILERRCNVTKEAAELALDDAEAAEVPAVSRVIRYEYHVLYSCSFQVPVLYFRASFLDGRPLTLEDIWEGVHECYRTRLLQGPWDTITQQIHLLKPRNPQGDSF
nr:ubiquitin-like-conjugating enzyme ATG10 isoform X2 [Oryctolagus cuniculus]